MGFPLLAFVVLVAIFVTSFVLLLATRYKRCPSNKIMVVYGKVGGGKTANCIHGGAAFVIPLLQDYEYLGLEPIQIEVPLRDALSMENIRVNVPSVFTVAIGTDSACMQNAAIRLLGLQTPQVKKQAEDIIFGQLRQVIASMRIEEINRDRDNFLSKVQSSLEPELRKIGLVLINVNITDITDGSGYIEAIGKKAASQAVQQARADVAEQEKMGEIKVAENVREKEVRVAEANREKNVGVREAEREQAVRIADLAKEQAVGEQEAAYLRDTQIKESERTMRIATSEADARASVGEQEAAYRRDMQVADADREKRISVASANATAIEGENESKGKIAGSNATLSVAEAEAFQRAQTKTEQAKAAVLEAKNLALAKAALAEAERVEAERRAELEAPAKAEKARTIVEAEAEAEKRRIEAEGEGKAIFAKMEAEARGQYEVMRQKAEGLHKIVEACGGANQAFQMLMLEHLDKLAEESAKAIANIQFDKVVVWETGGSDGKGSTAKFLQNMAHIMPPLMQTMRDIGGVELPESLFKMDMKPGSSSSNGPEHAQATPEASEPDGGEKK